MNFEAVDGTLKQLFEIKVPATATNPHDLIPLVGDDAPSVDPAHKHELIEMVERFFPEINLSGRTADPATARPAAEAVRG